MINTGEWDEAIRAEGEKAYPHECCGIMLGGTEPPEDLRRMAGIIPITNARETEEQYHRFRIEPEDLMKAELAARKQGLEVLGFYHSHPDHAAEPSDYDREHALPFYSYIIVSVEKGKAGRLTSWRLREDRTEFLEEAVCRE